MEKQLEFIENITERTGDTYCGDYRMNRFSDGDWYWIPDGKSDWGWAVLVKDGAIDYITFVKG